MAGKAPAGKVSSSQKGYTSPNGRVSFQLARIYLAGWKGFLPVGKVHVPCRLEGKFSIWRGISLLTGRKPFHPVRYILAKWKETIPSLPTGRKPFQPAIGLDYPWGYPDIRQVWGGERPSTAESVPKILPRERNDRGYISFFLMWHVFYYLPTRIKMGDGITTGFWNFTQRAYLCLTLRYGSHKATVGKLR
jgi:hypothetical protein